MTVYHLTINNCSYFFGSIAAIYSVFSYKTLRVKKETLYNFNIEQGRPYTNKIVKIEKGEIIRIKGNRSKKTKI